MLYDSTKRLLQSILLSLESGGEDRWDDRTESGNACLYEMHQMSDPLYKAYKSDGLSSHSPAQGGLPGILNRAMPHVRLMVIAIRHKDQTRALESGKAALAEMNRHGSISPGCHAEPGTEKKTATIMVRPLAIPTGKHFRAVKDRRGSKPTRVSSGK